MGYLIGMKGTSKIVVSSESNCQLLAMANKNPNSYAVNEVLPCELVTTQYKLPTPDKPSPTLAATFRLAIGEVMYSMTCQLYQMPNLSADTLYTGVDFGCTVSEDTRKLPTRKTVHVSNLRHKATPANDMLTSFVRGEPAVVRSAFETYNGFYSWADEAVPALDAQQKLRDEVLANV